MRRYHHPGSSMPFKLFMFSIKDTCVSFLHQELVQSSSSGSCLLKQTKKSCKLSSYFFICTYIWCSAVFIETSQSVRLHSAACATQHSPVQPVIRHEPKKVEWWCLVRQEPLPGTTGSRSLLWGDISIKSVCLEWEAHKHNTAARLPPQTKIWKGETLGKLTVVCMSCTLLLMPCSGGAGGFGRRMKGIFWSFLWVSDRRRVCSLWLKNIRQMPQFVKLRKTGTFTGSKLATCYTRMLAANSPSRPLGRVSNEHLEWQLPVK